MRTLVESTAFRKDVKRAHKRRYDFEKLDAIVKKLQRGEVLPPSKSARTGTHADLFKG